MLDKLNIMSESVEVDLEASGGFFPATDLVVHGTSPLQEVQLADFSAGATTHLAKWRSIRTTEVAMKSHNTAPRPHSKPLEPGAFTKSSGSSARTTMSLSRKMVAAIPLLEPPGGGSFSYWRCRTYLPWEELRWTGSLRCLSHAQLKKPRPLPPKPPDQSFQKTSMQIQFTGDPPMLLPPLPLEPPDRKLLTAVVAIQPTRCMTHCYKALVDGTVIVNGTRMMAVEFQMMWETTMPPPPPEPPDSRRGKVDAIVLPPFESIAVHPRHGVWKYVRVDVFEFSLEQLSISEYLSFKEIFVDGKNNDNFELELDFEAGMSFWFARGRGNAAALVLEMVHQLLEILQEH